MIDAGLLCAIQHADGGWGYGRDLSAVEPTALALLALAGSGQADSPAFARGAAWMNSVRRSDGGWPPRPGVAQSTWVTALALLLPPGALPEVTRRSGENWLMSQTGRESRWSERLSTFLSGDAGGVNRSYDGWPWYPGASGWTVPTAITVLALSRLYRTRPAQNVSPRIQEGRDFLLARRCADGGWNYGADRTLGIQASSYPETTGIALLGLVGVAPQAMAESLRMAEKHLAHTRSREAASWLQLGLTAHGRRPLRREFPRPPLSTTEIAVSILAECALDGRSVFA